MQDFVEVQVVGVHSSELSSSGSTYMGYLKAGGTALYSPFGSVSPDPFLINGAEVLGIFSITTTIGNKTYHTSGFSSKNRKAFNFESVEVNGVLYLRSAFQKFFPTDVRMLSTIRLDSVDFFKDVPTDTPITIKFNL